MGLETVGERAFIPPAEAGMEAHKALLRAAEELQTQLDERDILRVIATQLAAVVPYDNGLSVYLLTPDGAFLQPMYADGPFSDDILTELPFTINQGISGSVARSGRGRIANDAMNSSDVRVVDGTTDDSLNMLAVPLCSHKQVLGVLVLYRALDWLFVSADLDLAQLFANQAAIAIENARLLARERERVNVLEELDRMRADFVSTVSHELRTPLTGIIGFTETLQGYWERMSDDKKLEMVDKIRLSGLRLERLVHDLLFISRVESGNVPLQLNAVDVAAAVMTAVQEIGGKYRGQRVVVEAPLRAVHAQADYDRLCQVMVNLLDNAIKYSPEGSAVTAQWEENGSEAVIAVRDHGRGISPDDLPRLFTRFGKIGTTIRAGHVGTGLGLYIARGMVDGMRGRIWVDSTVGQGSVFYVAFPLASD